MWLTVAFPSIPSKSANVVILHSMSLLLLPKSNVLQYHYGSTKNKNIIKIKTQKAMTRVKAHTHT